MGFHLRRRRCLRRELGFWRRSHCSSSHSASSPTPSTSQSSPEGACASEALPSASTPSVVSAFFAASLHGVRGVDRARYQDGSTALAQNSTPVTLPTSSSTSARRRMRKRFGYYRRVSLCSRRHSSSPLPRL